MTTTNQVLSLTDLESYDPHAKTHGSERRFLCPVCGDSKPRDDDHRSFALNTGTGAYICHRCKEKGLIKENWTKQPFTPRKVRTAAALARVFSVESTPNHRQEQKNASENESQIKLERLRREMKEFQAAFENSPAQDYLQQRGIAPETAKAFGCGYAERFEHWKKTAGEWEFIGADRRVVFPITNPSGQVIAYHGRAIDDVFIDTPKKTKGSRKEALFQTADAFDADVIFLCEGPADAMALHECGFAAVASVATSIPSWLPSAVAYNKIMVALDADETGDRDAEKHISELRAHGARAVRLRPENGKDWNDVLQKTGIYELRRFVEEKIAAAYPDYDSLLEPEPQAESVIIEDVFDCENESGQLALDYLFAAAEKHGNELLLEMPTVDAYESECDLVAAVVKHSRGETTDAALERLSMRFINAHLLSDDGETTWTNDAVPLFQLTLKINGERTKNLTCNRIQSWITREFWLRKTPEAEIGLINL